MGYHHLAFATRDLAETHRTTDPDRILVEFCVDTAPHTAADEAHAEQVLSSPAPELEAPPTPVFHRAATARVAAASPA